MSGSDDAALRAARRGSWPGELTSLAGTGDAADLRAFTTPEERVALVWELTRTAWALSGRPMPSYTRAEMPGRLIRLSEDL